MSGNSGSPDRKRGLGLGPLGRACLAGVLVAGCHHSPWPDEPGVPLELVRSANVVADDSFFSLLTEQRRVVNLGPPITAPRYQSEIRVFAEDLQTGKLSAAAAEHAVEKWARAAYGRAVDTYAIDCSAGALMPIPQALVTTPTLVIAHAAAHFRPRSLPTDQCVILVAKITGTEHIEQVKL